MYRFELFTGKDGQTHFRFVASNNEIMFSSEGYERKVSAIESIYSIKHHVVDAKIVDLSKDRKTK